MKLLELAEFYSEQGGGVRTYIAQKFEAAHKAGHSLSILAPGIEDRVEARRGGKLIWVKSPPIPMDKRYHFFWDKNAVDHIISIERPDFIEGSSPWRGAWFAGRQSPEIPKALFIHQDPVLTYPQTLLRQFLNEDRIDRSFAWFFCYFRRLQNLFQTSVVSSEWMSMRLAANGMKKPIVIPFGVKKSEFETAARSEELRADMLARCGVNAPDAKLLITVSRHHPEKRLPMLMEAFQMAKLHHPMGLFIIGDGPDRAKIEKLAKKTPGVHIAGFLSDRELLGTMLASSDAYIHGCPAETFGLVIAEALCAGLPQIVPDRGGAAEIPSNESASFYQSDNAQSCAAAIIRLFARDQAALKQAARHDAGKVSDMAEHFKVLFNMYEGLAEQHSARRRCQQLPIGNELAVSHQNI